LLANSESLAALFTAEPNTAAERLGQMPKVQDRVREAFYLALGRQPDARELTEGTKFLQTKPNASGAAAGELLWALVAGPEFLTNH